MAFAASYSVAVAAVAVVGAAVTGAVTVADAGTDTDVAPLLDAADTLAADALVAAFPLR